MNCLSRIAFVKKTFVVLSITSLSACSFIYGDDGLIKDTTYDYLKAKQEKDIVIPKNLSHKNKADYAVVPDIGEKAKKSLIGSELQNISPVQILDVIDNVRIDKQAENPAIFIQDETDFIWQTVVELFEENKITAALLDRENLLIDTGWLAADERGLWLGIKGSEEIEEFKARYRISLSTGLVKGETHLEVQRVSAQKLNEQTEKWQDVASFWEDSAQMLNMLIVNYDRKYTQKQIDKKASAVAGFTVELASNAEGNAALITSENKERVWDVLPKILEAAHFEVSDKDRRSMTYFIEYKENEPGFFASLFSAEEEKLPIEYGHYQVTLSNLGEQTAITFNDAQGQALESSLVVKMYPILSQLFGNRR